MSGVFKYRSADPEMLDMPDISADQLFQNLKELEKINRLLGGHTVTIEGIKRLIPAGKKEFSVCDIGCGGGDTLLAIHKWAVANGYQVKLTGLDLLPDAATYAREKLKNTGANIIAGDVHQVPISFVKADVVISSLVCHHLYGEDLEQMIHKMYEASRYGIVINDLHRHPFAYYSIVGLTRVLSKSVLVKNDAPLSVKKAFTLSELQDLFGKLGLKAEISWKWAFRYLITVKKDECGRKV